MPKRPFREDEPTDPGSKPVSIELLGYDDALQHMLQAGTFEERFAAYQRAVQVGSATAETFRPGFFPYKTSPEGFHAVSEEEFRAWEEKMRAGRDQRAARSMEQAAREAEQRKIWDKAAAEGRLAELLDADDETRQYPVEVLRAAEAERQAKKKKMEPKTIGQNIGDALDGLINWFKR